MQSLFPNLHSEMRTMIFVDGENLAIRFADELTKRGNIEPIDGIFHKKNIYVWSVRFRTPCIQQAKVIRIHYYTSVQGDDAVLEEVVDELQSIPIEQPAVFKKFRGKRSKRVDISLTTDMLLHASRRNYETAVLVAGDEDYVPLVQAVKAQGCRVIVWFLQNGLSPTLRRSADMFVDLEHYLFKPAHIVT